MGRIGIYGTTDTCSQKPPRLELPIIVCSSCTIWWVIHQPNAAVRWALFMETTSFVIQYVSQMFMDWVKIKYRSCYCKKQIPSAPRSRSEVDCWINHLEKLQMNYLCTYKPANTGFNCYNYEEMFSECEECTFDTSWQPHKSTWWASAKSISPFLLRPCKLEFLKMLIVGTQTPKMPSSMSSNTCWLWPFQISPHYSSNISPPPVLLLESQPEFYVTP